MSSIHPDPGILSLLNPVHVYNHTFLCVNIRHRNASRKDTQHPNQLQSRTDTDNKTDNKTGGNGEPSKQIHKNIQSETQRNNTSLALE